MSDAPAMPPFDFKQNMLDFLHHKETPLTPNQFVGNKIMGFGAINGPAIEKGDQFGPAPHLDGFGNAWEYPASGDGAAVPDVKVTLLDDIEDWREKVTIPDPLAYDWKAEYERECQLIGEPDREHELVDFGFGNGAFERLAALIGFVDALMALMEEPEETAGLLTAITDYKVAALDPIIDAFHPDTITYYDDIATQANPFMSPKVYRDLIKPQHKRFAQECLKRGVIPIYHCCGHVESLVEDFIDCGWAAWNSVQVSNDIESLIQKHGHQIGFIGGYDTNGRPATMDATDDEVRAEVRRCYDTYGRFGYGYSFFGFRCAGSLDPAVSAAAFKPIVEEAVGYSMKLMGQKAAAVA